MSKKIAYSFSGKYEDYNDLLRNYRLDSLLININKESSFLFVKNPDGPGPSRQFEEKLVSDTGKVINQKGLVTPWELLYLAYYAVLASNDYRGKIITQKSEFNLLVLATSNYLQAKEKNIHNRLNKTRAELFLYLFGFFGEQGWTQTMPRIIENLSREVYILIDLSDNQNRYKRIIKDQIGADWEKVIKSLMVTFLFSMIDPKVNTISDNVKWNEQLKREEYLKVINYYSVTYEEIRDSNLERQLFYAKPFVKTQRSGIIGINAYYSFKIMEHSLLWLLKDYYNSKDGDFQREFGEDFEKYVRELFENYLPESSFKKIPVCNKGKRADWIFTVKDKTFLVEQKSSLAPVQIKQQQPNIDVIENFSKNIIEAIEQLDITEKEYTKNEKCIKIILLYEDYLSSECLDYIFDLKTCPVDFDGSYWMMNIDEFERFIELSKNDEAKFQELVNKKCELEEKRSMDGKSIDFLLRNMNINAKGCLANPKIHDYHVFLQNISDEYIR